MDMESAGARVRLTQPFSRTTGGSIHRHVSVPFGSCSSGFIRFCWGQNNPFLFWALYTNASRLREAVPPFVGYGFFLNGEGEEIKRGVG